VLAAEHVTTEKMAFMIRHTGGVVCLALSCAIADQLDLPPMVLRNTSKRGTPYTVSIDGAEVDTGISAADRTKTVLAAINPVAQPGDLRRPGHIFPLRAEDGGVLKRAGHTEAGVDLCRLAGLREGAVISELMHEDGSMMRLPVLLSFAKGHDLAAISIADLIAWRRRHETFVRLEAETELETETGTWTIRIYRDTLNDLEHIALIKGKVHPLRPLLVRAHSECLTGETFHSLHCDCGNQLEAAMERISEEQNGIVLYMRQEGRGIGLTNKMKAYELQRKHGLDTAEANEKLGFPTDLRDYGVGAQILKDCGVGKMRLLTNNPKKVVGLSGFGLEIVERVALETAPRSDRQRQYLQAKRRKFGHLFSSDSRL
jgi:3,4-dihydroxy 2-butanone 4-phosphate synthase / GTP cyclohydrolase II